jgi:hypothetical protein
VGKIDWLQVIIAFFLGVMLSAAAKGALAKVKGAV